MSDESKISEDLPDEIAEKVLRIFPDFGIVGDAYLWDLNGVCIGAKSVGGSEEFVRRLQTWAARWEECMDNGLDNLITHSRLGLAQQFRTQDGIESQHEGSSL